MLLQPWKAAAVIAIIVAVNGFAIVVVVDDVAIFVVVDDVAIFVVVDDVVVNFVVDVVVVVVVYLKRLRIVLRCAKAGCGRRTSSS